MFDNRVILLTGGTGSFGKKFTKMILDKYNPKKLIVFSRDEMKQWEMAKKYQSDSRIRFQLGDVRDRERLYRAMNGVDLVVHAAATKIVPTAEYDPFECVKTNVFGAMNVIDASIDCGVGKVVALSTDKACSPVNLYGATKLTSDKLFISGNYYSGSDKTKFSVVRYGNVMGSRGSVIPLFNSLGPNEKVPITDKRMTRFMITLEEGVDLVIHAFNDMLGGEIYVKKIPSMNICDIAKAICPDKRFEFTGIRAGEKIHEEMITVEDSLNTYEYDAYFKILPQVNDFHLDKNRIKDGRKVPEGFSYSSGNNKSILSIDELQKWLEFNEHEFE